MMTETDNRQDDFQRMRARWEDDGEPIDAKEEKPTPQPVNHKGKGKIIEISPLINPDVQDED